MFISRVCRIPLRVSQQSWSDGRVPKKIDQMTLPLAFVLAASGLCLSTFSLRQLGLLNNKDRRQGP